MATIPSPLSSVPASSTPSTNSSTGSSFSIANPPAFNGTSQYAQDLENALTRAVQIASMPITQLQNQRSLLTEQQQAYQSLEGKVADVGTAIQGLVSAMGTSSYSANNSNPSA